MHLDNVEILRTAADKYLEECLSGEYDKEEGFKDSGLYKVQQMYEKEENELETIVVSNKLLNQEMGK